MTGKKIIIITGCDTGIGRHLGDLLIKRNHNIAISYLEKNPFSKNKLVFAEKLMGKITSPLSLTGFV